MMQVSLFKDFLFISDFWKIFFNYTYVGKHNSFIIGDLKLHPGRFYRSSLRFCVESICFKPVKSDGFIVLHNYPKTGRIETVYKNISAMSDQVRCIVIIHCIFITHRVKINRGKV